MAVENLDIKPEQVNLEDWDQSGEGWNAITYYHKTDGSLLLKLNSESSPAEAALTEFKLAKAAYNLGVRSPKPVRFVSDGKRFGFISERLSGKKSFARILSEQPEMLEPLAKDMAEAARVLHSLPCDTDAFESIADRVRKEFNSCKWIRGRMRAILNSYGDGLRPMTTCLHGDMHPGNYLRTDKGDFWIDMGRFGYGDPDLDYASQYILAHLAPESMTKYIIHIDHATYGRFVELYGRYYYGEEFDSAQTQERLRRAVCFLMGHGMTKSPAASLVFRNYILGNGKITSSLLRIIR